MKNFLWPIVILALLAVPGSAEKVDLGAGKIIHLIVPETWTSTEPAAGPPGMLAMGKTLRYVTRNGSNDAVLITIVTVPDDRFSDPGNLKSLVEESTQQIVSSSVEGKADLKEFRLGGRSGISVTFTDAALVGKPSEKENYKALTTCFVYLGERLLLTATVFSDDMAGKTYAEGMHILKSIALELPKDTL
jgi:hypothetical protein